MLAAATPEAWVVLAVERWQELLVDHANCEKKAASTALALLFAYPEDRRLGIALSRLAREELRHFEQVQRLMARLGVAPKRMGPGRYASGLRRHLAATDPQRKIDLMLCGALIEARSCERFDLLAPRLPAPLGDFYAGLSAAERRHRELYLELARESGREMQLDERMHVQERLAHLASEEALLATSADDQFRFHSGAPAGVMA